MIPGPVDFIGLWRLERDITDRAGGPSGRFSGQARFEPRGSGLLYRETGQLVLGDQPALTATRDYIWRSGPDGIEVLFADQRPFHVIPAGQYHPKASHYCPPDQYDVAYDFADFPNWCSRWRVLGPRKNYWMVSKYTKS